MALQITITGKGLRRTLTWLAAIAALVLVAFVLWRLVSARSGGVERRIDTGGYQAISLTTGQLYFGRLRDTGGEFVEVRDAHYIREVEGAKEGDATRSEVVPTSTQLHRPRSRLVLPRSQVVTIEDLADDSAAVKAITDGDKD